MSESNGSSGVLLKWAHLLLILVVQILLLGAVWGSLNYQVAEHGRRLDIIEKRQEDNFLSRQEFEKRHEDLQRRVEELRERVQQLEMRGAK